MKEIEIDLLSPHPEEEIRPKKRRARLNQRRRRKLKELKLAQHGQLPKVMVPMANGGEPDEADLRIALKAKKLEQRNQTRQASRINHGEPMHWTTTEGPSMERNYVPTRHSSLCGTAEEVDLTGLVDLDGRPMGYCRVSEDDGNEQRNTTGHNSGRPRLAITSESGIDGALWTRVAEGAKRAMREGSDGQDEEGFRLWEGTNEDQRNRWT